MLQKHPSAEAVEVPDFQDRRMEIVGRLAGGIVHDFNNILTVIIGTAEVLGEAVADRPELAAIAGLISEAAARGADLTAHLLAFAGNQPSQPCDVDVNAVLVEAAGLLRPTLGGQIEIDTTLATEVPPAWVDPSQLMTAVLHLAVIARDAMPDGGKLMLESRSTVAGEGFDADRPGIAAAEGVVIAVRVSGISAERQGRAFADLGLARDFAARANGHIKVYRETGRGTSVEIHLPKAAAPMQAPAEASSMAGIDGGDEAILVVEDDVLVRRYVVGQIQSLGYRTLAAGNAGEALAIIEAGERIDLLLTDVMMPGSINGRQLAVAALRRRPSLRILYTSGYSENAMVDDGCLDAGALLLAKPYRKVDLAKMIRAALAA
jgi:CheY-like chemotaxis protein